MFINKVYKKIAIFEKRWQFFYISIRGFINLNYPEVLV